MPIHLTAGRDTFYGNSSDETIYGEGGDDDIYGYDGADWMQGGAGNDWLHGGNGNDRLIGDWDEDNGVDHLYGEDGDDDLFGGSGNDFLYGGTGRDYLDGGTGIDTMYGGTENDWYRVDDVNDSVVEFAGQGIDLVDSYATAYTLSANVENLTLYGSATDGTGNSLANVIHGNGNNNWIWGLDGNDDLYGEDGNDHLYGGDGWDLLVGGAGYDHLDGGASFDDMYGGIGDDFYVVDNVSDWVIEYAGEGNDAVASWVDNYLLPDNVENLYLSGSADIDGYGNTLNNIIEGNSGNNILSGNFGNDTLYGWDGDDWLAGDSGSDYMRGGLGDDMYDVDSAGDTVVEFAGEGRDIVHSRITYTLGANIEDLQLDDLGGAINGTGNALDNYVGGNRHNNVLHGEAGDDDLDGKGGNDTMYGGTGQDVFHVDQAGDVVVEYSNEGIDQVYSTIDYTLTANVEILHLVDAGGAIDGTGNGLENTIWGNASGNTLSGLGNNDWLHGLGGNDALWGDSGADNLWGGAGADMLYGGTGTDRFIIESAADTTDGVLHDHIMDFSSGDRIDVSSIDANSMVAGNQAFSYLGANAFTGVAGQLNYVGGYVQGDVNGDRVADFMLEVNAFSLAASDFIL
jgi:Ca2+-binding RTX toxin-like protein